MEDADRFEEARIQRARDYANQPWIPGKVVCPMPEQFHAAKVFSRLVMLQRQLERMIRESNS